MTSKPDRTPGGGFWRHSVKRLAGFFDSVRDGPSRLGVWYRRRRERRDKTPTARQRRRRRRILIAAIVALLAYPVLGTLALWTGFVEWILKSEDLRVEIENPAYTLWPGHVHMKRVKILVNGETQFTLEGSALTADIRLFPMFKRRFHVNFLHAEDVRYRMRVQVKDTRGIEERLAAYPPLPDLPGVNVIREKEAEKTEKREPSWTVEVEGIDARVSELWFMEYRYLGHGTLKGEFLVGPHVMRVGTSVQDLGPGDLRFGADQVIAKNFRGQISASVPEVNPEEHADERFLDLVTANINLKADVETLKHLSAYFDGIDVARGKGSFNTKLALEKGWLGKQSVIQYQTDAIRVSGSGFTVDSDWKLDIDVEADAEKGEKKAASNARKTDSNAPRPRIESHSKSTFVSLSKRPKRAFTLKLLNHTEQATLKSTQIGSGMALKKALIELPNIQSSDLDDLDMALAEGSPLRVQRGSGLASLRLDVDENYVARGPFTLRLDGLKFQLAGVNLGTNARAYTRVRFDLKKKNTTLDDFRFSVADASMHVGDEDVDDWWAILSSDRISAAKLPPRSYEATLTFQAKDAEPILEALAEKDKLNDLIAKFTSLDNITLIAKVRGRGPILDITIESMESDVWDAAGRYYSDGKHSRLALVVGGKAVSIGIASDGKHTSIVPFAHARWLNRQLLTFPKPLEQIKPPQP